jgi:hypothetical protein
MSPENEPTDERRERVRREVEALDRIAERHTREEPRRPLLLRAATAVWEFVAGLLIIVAIVIAAVFAPGITCGDTDPRTGQPNDPQQQRR